MRALLGSRRRTAGVLAAVATAAAVATVAFAQPLGSAWWLYADSDAVYVGSGLNLASGHHTRFFDHPGLPLQQLIAAGAVVGGAVSGESPRTFAERQLLHIDAWKPYFRGFGLIVYFAGAALSFLLLSRLLGGPLWGAAGAFLWLGAPGILPMAIQYRPDPLASLLALVVTVLCVESVRRRDPIRLAGAGVLVGLAITLKYSCVLLLVPLAIAAVAARPGGDVRQRVRGLLRRRLVLVGVAAWISLAIVLNWASRTSPNRKQLVAVVALLAVAGAWAALARAVRRFPLDAFGALVVASVALGLLLPVSLTLEDGGQMLIWLGRDLTGSGPTGSGFGLRGFAWDAFREFPLWPTIAVFALACAGGVLGLLRRDWGLVLVGAGTVVGLVALGSHLKSDYYLAPFYMVAVPGALLLVRRLGERAGLVAAAALAALLFTPQLTHVFHGRDSARAGERFAAAAQEDAGQVVPPSQVILGLAGQPLEDQRYFEFVQAFVNYTPPYPYRFLSMTPEAHAFAAAHGIRPTRLMQSPGTTVAFNRLVLERSGWTDYRAGRSGPAGSNGFRFLLLRPAPR